MKERRDPPLSVPAFQQVWLYRDLIATIISSGSSDVKRVRLTRVVDIDSCDLPSVQCDTELGYKFEIGRLVVGWAFFFLTGSGDM